MRITTGTYTGNGSDNRSITGVGFQPDFVFITSDSYSAEACWSSSALPSDFTVSFYSGSTVLGASNQIQAFESDGFQVGTHDNVNRSGEEYHYVAVQDNEVPDFAVGTYTGNDADNRQITGLGFQPTFVMTYRYGNNVSCYWRIDGVGDLGWRFDSISGASNTIQDFVSDGFEIGSSFTVNDSSSTYYYVAFRDAAGLFETGTYTGNATDDRDITVGFQPDAALVKRIGASIGVLRTDTFTGDSSSLLSDGSAQSNRIQGFGATTFEIGDSSLVNSSGQTYWWVAFQSGISPIAGSNSAYLAGQVAVSDSTAAYMAGISTATGDNSAYLIGKAETKDNLAAYLFGGIYASDNTLAYLAGIGPAADSITAYLDGRYSLLDNKFAYLKGQVLTETSDNKSAYIDGENPVRDSTSAYLDAQVLTRGRQKCYLRAESEAYIPGYYLSRRYPISVYIYTNLISGGHFINLHNITPASYQHTKSADDYFKAANISWGCTEAEVDEWISDGVGRHVEVYSADLDLIWEGFVNTVSTTVGGLSVRVGPLIEVANSVIVKYSDYSTGESTVTSEYTHAKSQAKYGIFGKVIQTGQISSTNAVAIAGTYLNEKKYPSTSQTISFSRSGPSVSIECVGYIELLKTYFPYNAAETTTTVSQKIQDILDLEPNGILSPSYANIETNTLSIFDTEVDYKTAYDVIKGLVSFGGDDDNNRRFFGLYKNRTAFVREIPEQPKYFLSVRSGKMYSTSGRLVNPWKVEPGEWAVLSDFMGQQTLIQDIRSTGKSDSRVILVEEVSYTAPYDLTINGGRFDTISQRMAKLGLGGI